MNAEIVQRLEKSFEIEEDLGTPKREINTRKKCRLEGDGTELYGTVGQQKTR